VKQALSACLAIILWAIAMLYSYKILAISSEDQAAITQALNNMPKINMEDLANNPDFKETLAVGNVNEDGHGQSYLPQNTSMDLIKDGKTKATTGSQLSKELTQHSEQLKQQAEQLNAQQIAATSKSDLEDLTVVEIVNKNLLDLETIPNAENPATEAAFTALAKSDEQLQQQVGMTKLDNTTLRQQYKAATKTNVELEEYEMGCSTTLLDSTFTCTKNLVIEVREQPDLSIKKLITASFKAHSYNHSIVEVNFKDGVIKLIRGNHIANSSISDRLGPEFGQDTQIIKRSEQAHAEEGCQNTLNSSPTFQNSFTAIYSNYQPDTDDYHWHSRKKKKRAAKNKRNQDRGATLQYEFMRMQPQPPVITNESWQGDCGELEDLTMLQECTLQSEVCLEGPAVRQFGSHEPYLRVERPCWKKRFTYHCKVPQGDNDCDSIPANCIKTGSEFKEFLGQKAVEIHHFKCSKTVNSSEEIVINSGFKAVALDDYQKNTDFGTAVAGLSLVKEIAKEIRPEGQGKAGKFFNGQAMHCTCKPKNCCADKKGFWRKMTGCKSKEIQLSENIRQGNCHFVDDYRVKKSVAQKAVHVDKQGYCCYQSKLSRVIQEGAKQQLNRSWGDGAAPQCEALTVDDLEHLDWSKIDFSEIAADFVKKAQNTKVSGSLLNAVSNNLTQTSDQIKKDYQKQLPDTPLRKQQAKDLAELTKKIATETARRKLHNAKQHKQQEAANEEK